MGADGIVILIFALAHVAVCVEFTLTASLVIGKTTIVREACHW